MEINKKFIFIIIVISFSLVYSLFFMEEEKIEQEYSEKIITPKYENIELKANHMKKDILLNDIEKKVAKNVIVKRIEEKKVEDKNKIILYSSMDSKERFKLNLISNKKADIDDKNPKEVTSFIIISGKIDEDGETSIYPMSLNENYLNLLNEIYLEIISIKEKEKKHICDGTFLDGIDKNFAYHIKVDIDKDDVSCYIQGQSDSPTLKNFDIKKIKFIKNNKNFKPDEKHKAQTPPTLINQ